MSGPRSLRETVLRRAEAGFDPPERERPELSEAVRDLKVTERARADKTSRLKAMRLEKEEAERLAKESSVVVAKKKPTSATKKKVESTKLRRGHGSA